MRPPGCNLFSAGSLRGSELLRCRSFHADQKMHAASRLPRYFSKISRAEALGAFVARGVADDARPDGLGLALDQFAGIARRLSSSCVASARRQRGGISLALCFSRRPSSPATDSFATPRAGDLPGSVQQCVDGIRGAPFRAVRRNRAPRRVGRSEAEVPEARR